MIDVKIFNVTVLMTNCCLLTDRKTGKMAVTDPVHRMKNSILKLRKTAESLSM